MSGNYPARPRMMSGTRSEYLASLAANFPERDSRGYVIGYYLYAGAGRTERLAGPFATRAALEADKACAPLIKAGWGRVVVGHVFTASGHIVRVEDDGAPDE
jgi:hypothetical protein